jgi:hypothetical protein
MVMTSSSGFKSENTQSEALMTVYRYIGFIDFFQVGDRLVGDGFLIK